MFIPDAMDRSVRSHERRHGELLKRASSWLGTSCPSCFFRYVEGVPNWGKNCWMNPGCAWPKLGGVFWFRHSVIGLLFFFHIVTLWFCQALFDILRRVWYLKTSPFLLRFSLSTCSIFLSFLFLFEAHSIPSLLWKLVNKIRALFPTSCISWSRLLDITIGVAPFQRLRSSVFWLEANGNGRSSMVLPCFDTFEPWFSLQLLCSSRLGWVKSVQMVLLWSSSFYEPLVVINCWYCHVQQCCSQSKLADSNCKRHSGFIFKEISWISHWL